MGVHPGPSAEGLEPASATTRTKEACMRKFLVSVALATATLATAVPVAAQAQVRSPYRPLVVSRADINGLVRDLNRVDLGITRSLQRRVISQREALTLRREA